MNKCSYCQGKIPEDRYVVMNYKTGIKNGYCSGYCKNRAGTLRMGVRDKKYMPKSLDDVDKKYIEKYVVYLQGI